MIPSIKHCLDTKKTMKNGKKKKISLVGSQQPTQSSMTQHEPKKQESKWYQEKDF